MKKELIERIILNGVQIIARKDLEKITGGSMEKKVKIENNKEDKR